MNTTKVKPEPNFIYSNTDEFNIFSIIHIIIITIVIVHIIYLILMIIKINFFKNKDDLSEKERNLKKINEICTICLEHITNEVQLLCSHSFCSTCIILYAKQRFSFINVECPYCRTCSKLMIVKYERTEENSKEYDEIVSYNHEFTSKMKTTFCFCIDTLRFFFFYTRQILDFSNPRYAKERCCLLLIMIIVFIIILYPILGAFNQVLVIIEDIFIYSVLIFMFAEFFYRSFRRRNEQDYENYVENSVNISQNSSFNIENNQNNQNDQSNNREINNQ